MMARRKTANCTFKFSFPLLPPPPPPLRQNSPTNSRKIVGIKAAPINPRRGFIRRKRRVSSRRDSRVGRDATRQSDPCSRNIYNPRILAWLSHTPTEYRPIFLFARSPCPPLRYRQEIVVTLETTWNEDGTSERPLLGFVQQRKIRLFENLSLFYFSRFILLRRLVSSYQEGKPNLQEDRPFFFKMERVWYERLGSSSQ